MDTKICSKCNLSKLVNEYYIRNGKRLARCKVCVKEWIINWKKNNKDRVKSYREKENPEMRKKSNAKYRANNKLLLNEKAKENYKLLKKEIIDHYSNGLMRCDCCNEKTFEFLCIDHIRGDGSKHRKEIGSGRVFYAWIKKNNFPFGLRVLCYNCNSSLGHHGYCPHKKEKYE